MTTKLQKMQLLDEHFPAIQALKSQAEKAFGSRATDSHNHEASRKYTDLIKNYAEQGGSLLILADALEVTYPALRRRVMTADVTPLTRHSRSKATADQYAYAVQTLTPLRDSHNTEAYHDALLEQYDNGLSINHLAKELGLKSAYPLYYGINKARIRKEGK